jgi:hypothetical protein
VKPVMAHGDWTSNAHLIADVHARRNFSTLMVFTKGRAC